MLSAVERKIEQFIQDVDSVEVHTLYKKISKGKMLRARLIGQIAGKSLLSIKLASVVEMIHMASLLHDDVIDDTVVRRGKTSINATNGSKIAIMMGDILYSKAFFELNKIDSKVSSIISNAVISLSIGELNDVNLSNNFHTDKSAYLEMIYQKTASLIEASAQASALLVNKNSLPYKQYGRNLGIAFQMMDDILDITSDEKTLGKPTFNDFSEGKVTLPYIYLYEALDECDKARLIALYKKPLNQSQKEWIKKSMFEHKIIQKAFLEAKILINEAVELMESCGEYSLSNIARAMIEREF
ncbi:MAG: octaprenyl-diphosphate synthase [Sulfurovum sp. AS07-7]|nr:MAG: octaprenyl-diphosphate synthase [Sulfurovum sp. AS07-7]